MWHKARRSILVSRQHLLNEAEQLLVELPEALRETLPDTKAVRPRLRALVAAPRPRQLRIRRRCCGCGCCNVTPSPIAELDRADRDAAAELRRLGKEAGSTLQQLCGIGDRIEAELLVEVGDPRRFTGEGGFARFNGTAPLPASSAEGDGEPIRHRLNRGGNRRVNACLHRIAVTQLRCNPHARKIYDDARRRGHTKKEAMRILKRQLSNVVYRQMTHDLQRRLDTADPPLRAA